MEPENKMDKQGLRDKNRISAKEFIKMKRGQAKEEKNSSESFDLARSFITNNEVAKLEEFFMSSKAPFVLTFLFSQDQLKQTPLINILQAEGVLFLLQAANRWSAGNSDLIVREIYMEDNQFKSNHFRGKFQAVNKSAMEALDRYVTAGRSTKQLIMLLGEKDGLFYHLCKNFLTLQMVISTVCSLKSKNDLLAHYYMPLLTCSPLNQLIQLTNKVHGYQDVLMRDRFWNKGDSSIIKEVTLENIHLITLKEINYNIWHHIAHNCPKEFHRFSQLVISIQEEELKQKYMELLGEVNSSGETVTDICLKTWSFEQITGLFRLAKKIDAIMLSTACLNKLFYNRKLKQDHRQSLITECLEGEISKKGYINVITNKRKKQCHRKGKKIVLERKPVKYTFNISFDKGEIKRRRDNTGSYPLLTYLRLYKQTASLKIVQQLYLQFLNRKEIKKKMQILMKSTEQKRITLEKASPKYQEIQAIIYYYQAFWKVITCLPHTDVLEFLVSKTYLNCYEIKLFPLNKKVQIELFGKHFLIEYFSSNPFLGQDAVNRQILEGIVNAKQTEKKVGGNELYLELTRSLVNHDNFLESKEYLAVGIKSYLNQQLIRLPSKQLFIISHCEPYEPLLDIISNQLANGKASILSRQQALQKYNPDKLIEDYQTRFKYFKGQKQPLKKFYQEILKNHSIAFDDEEEEDEVFDWLNQKEITTYYQLQNVYFQYYGKDFKNKLFFDNIHPWLKVRSTTFLKEELARKYWSFRLRANEKHLRYKFQRLLQLGFDPYFSKYSETDIEFKEEQPQWNLIMSKMLKEKKTFLGALITSSSKLGQFAQIFETNFTRQNYDLKLYKKIQQWGRHYKTNLYKPIDEDDFWKTSRDDINRAPYFVEDSWKGYNLELIADILTLALKHGLSQDQFSANMRYFFQQRFRQHVSLIKQHQTIHKISTQEGRAAQSQKIIDLQKNAEALIDRWVPQLTKMRSQSQQDQQKLHKYLIRLLTYARNLECPSVANSILEHIVFERVCQTKLVVDKLESSKDADEILNAYLSTLTDDALSTWISRTIYSEKTRITAIAKTFSVQGQINIILPLINRIQSHQDLILHAQLREVRLVSEKIIYWTKVMVKILLASVAKNNLVKVIKTINDVISKDNHLSLQTKNQYYVFLLSTTDDVQLIALALLVTNVEYFFLRQSGKQKVNNYHVKTFYVKCKQESYKRYLKVLQEHHSLAKNIGNHIKVAIISLIQAQQWSRLGQLFQIKTLQSYMVPVIFKALYQTFNKQSRCSDAQVGIIVNQIFTYLQAEKAQFNEDLFVAAFSLDYQRAFKIFKPRSLSIYGFRRCIPNNPESAPLFLSHKVALNVDYLPSDISAVQSKRLKYWFPMIPHSNDRIAADKWLVDELRVELLLADGLKAQRFMIKTLKSLCSSEDVLAHKTEIYERVLSDKSICGYLLRCRQLKSLANYEKSLPNLKKMVKQELFGSILSKKKGKCMNLNILNPMLLRDFITSKELSSNEPINMCSCFLRIVEAANLYLLELFITTNKITITYEYLKTVQQFFGFSFWDHLLDVCNQDFIIAFINKYKLFEMYSPEQYSLQLLNTICRFRYNKLLEFVIKHVQGKSGSKAIFAAETIQNKPSISKNAILYLPIEISTYNNFYQIYFLIQGSGNQCPKFPLSGRFLSYMKPQEWNYIPQFKRRVEINNTFMETLREAQDMDFRFKVLLPSIFELQVDTEPLPQQVGQENLKQKPKKNNAYLAQFIHDITKKCLNLNNQSGIFEKLCFMIFKKDETKIPQAQLERKYPAQMKLINKIRKFIDNSTVHLTLWQLFDYVPQFKSHLLIYNPSTFLENQDYLQQIMGIGDKKLDFSEYLKGIEVNFIEFQQKYPHVLQNYIKEYFFNSSVRLGSPKASLHLTREALLLIFLDVSHHQRRWQHCSILNLCEVSQRFEQINYQQMHTQMEPERSPQEIIYDIAMCLNTRGKKAMNFDLMTWNKLIQEIQEIEEFWKKMGKGTTIKQYSFNPQQIDNIACNYARISSNRKNKYKIINQKDILCEVYYQQVKNCSKKGVFIELSLILNMFLIANDLKVLEQKIQSIKGGSNIEKINVKLVRNVSNPIKFQPATQGSSAEISIEVPFAIHKHESKEVSLFIIDDTNIISNIRHSTYLSSLQTSPSINELNDYCSQADRHPFLKNYRFRYTVQSLKSIKYGSLTNILEHGTMKNDGAVGKIIYELEKMEERLIGTKNIKVYSSSDIYGPINFSQQLDDEKIIDCLGFYELIDLPKEEQVRVTYVDKEFTSQQKNQLALKQIRDYLKFYISVSKDENVGKLDLSSQILVSVRKYKNEQRVQLDWWRFGGWTVCEVYCLAMNYCSDLSSKIDKILDVRVSFASLINYYEKYLQCGNQLSIKIALEKFLFQKHFNRFVESIILMITQDVGNIMKIVKGIIIKWSINKEDAKRKGKIRISQFSNAISVEYGIKDQILSIMINVQMRKGLNKTQELKENNQDYHVLVDRKQFLDSVFTSAQFLTDYFILRNQLNNECLRISTSITNKLNSTVNFYIEYSNLYAYVEKMRNEKSIKVIESFLIRLKQYLSNSMDKTIQLYLNSQELANRHQVFILNKCEAINKGLPFKIIQSQKELVYDSLETDPATGLAEVISLMNQIGNDQNIKNVFLIQIYKSYYTTMVGQGMTFVVGYKSSKKKAQVIKITKAENINLINIVELDFIMLVSKNIPTNDQLNQSKIIRIFITDSNKNLYQLNDKIKQCFLTLPQENQERNLSYFAPLIPSNVMLKFALEGKKEGDIKDTKVFFVDLNESQKFKLVPTFDKPLSPLNTCKKNLEFKQAVNELKKGFKNFTHSSMKFIIDLPQEYTQKYISTNFSHIIHLVSTDLLQFLLKFQFEPMRNETLDCKLSIENSFILNKNSIIQLRKRSYMKHYNRLRLRIRDTAPGISFTQKQVSIAIDVSNMTTLPSSTEYLSTIVDNILKNEKKELPQYVTFGHADKNQSTQVLLKELDIINSIPFQIHQVKEAIQLIELIFKAKASPFQIIIHNKKTQIKFDKGIEIYISTGSVQREFFSAEDIIRSYIGFLHKNFEHNTKGHTYYNPIYQRIITEEIASENIKIIYKNMQQRWISQDLRNFSQKSVYKLPSKYYLLQSNNIYSNYFFKADKQLAIKEKDAQGTRCKSKHLYLQSSKTINLNFTNISIAETSPLFKQNANSFNILRSPLDKNKITIQLLSKNMYFITINYEQSMILNINYAGNTNIFKQQLDSTRMVISSDGQLCLDNTKFLQLEAYKKKPVLIKDKQNQIKHSQFRESNQHASEKELQLKLGDFNNIENLVYVVNDQCKRFLTRAGQPRVDYIQLCDNDGNPIDYKAKLQVMFVHINKLAILRPEIIPRNMQLGLKWTPTIRGHYYLYINNVRTNPPYEIGVCAAQADYTTTIVTLPKIKKICYCQETQLMMDLRDSFGNLYTQLQEDILGDSLLIELKCSRLNEVLKIEKSQINKYGLKKVKFSFNNTEQQKATDIEVVVFLNCEEISKFVLTMEGLSLKQRKKLLQKDISLSSKNYYKDISINRNRFLQDLFAVAEKSLHTNLSVRFVNEPGIDAGGVKREFYDMIGNQIKSERNPFFKMINPNTMEYFLNPEILRNKKKLEYMQLWGKYLANSFLNSYLVGVSFSPVFVKLLYEQSIDYEDLLSVLPQEERKQYEYLLTASAEDFEDLDLYFTVIVDKKKCIQVELKQGGKDIRVTPQNVKEYLEYTAQILLTERYKQIMIAFRKGFETVLQLKIFKKWIRNSEFWCLTTGNKEITPELVLNYIVFQGSGIDNISGWFRRFISEANHEVLVGFLKFSSGSSSIDFSLSSKVTVTFENAGENPKKLPISHTCWKEIVVPKYKNYDIMKKLLTAAFIYCSEGFGFG